MKTFRKRAYAKAQGSKLKRDGKIRMHRVVNVQTMSSTLIYRNNWILLTPINGKTYLRSFWLNNWNDGSVREYESLKEEIDNAFRASKLPF